MTRSALLGAIAGFLFATMALGVLMRWDLVTGLVSAAGWSFGNLRHAHSHAGFFGVLTFGWWLVLARGGAAPPRWLFSAHVVVVGLCVPLFAAFGYRAPTIALSVLVAGAWLYCGYRGVIAKRNTRAAPAWLDVAPLGLAAGTALLPWIALSARRDLAFSRQLAHVFIAVTLLTVFVPAAWQSLGLARRPPALLYFALSVLAAVHLVFDAPLGFIGAILTSTQALLVVAIVMPLPTWPRLLWLFLPIGTLAASFDAGLRSEAFRIAGLHVVILVPVLLGLLAPVLQVPRAPLALYLLGVLAMAGSIVLPAFAPSVDAPFVTAVSSSVLIAVTVLCAISAGVSGERLR